MGWCCGWGGDGWVGVGRDGGGDGWVGVVDGVGRGVGG